MLWQLLIAVASIITSPFRAPVDPDHPYQATRYGPKSWRDAVIARQSLQGENDDMLFPDGVGPSYAGINGSNYRWPNNTLIYEPDADIQADQAMMQLIDDTIKMYEANTCLRFKVRTTETSYVLIKKDPGKCYAHVGLIDSHWQPQSMSLDDGCRYIGTVVHEFGHAIGLFHEHQRSDRDSHITVYGNNVDPAYISNFNVTEKVDELTFGAQYDYNSIMHYGECAFSKQPYDCPNDPNLRTMVANDGTTKLLEPYDKPGLDQSDIDLVKNLYNCP